MNRESGEPDISVADSLSELDAELERIPDLRKSVYLEAKAKFPELVNDDARAAFLRAEGFDAKLAALRLIDHWEHKHKLFGSERCFLPLTLSGALKEEDLVALSHGVIRLLPVKDGHGRAIVLLNPARHDPSKYSRENMLRATWYLFHSAMLKDPAVWQRGVILLATGSDDIRIFDHELYNRIFELENRFLPLRWKSIHLCCPGQHFRIASPILKFFLGKRLQARLKVHFGSQEEVMGNMKLLGLPPDRVPRELGGTVELDHSRWLLERWNEEQSRHGSDGTDWAREIPQSVFDIIGNRESIAACRARAPSSGDRVGAAALPSASSAQIDAQHTDTDKAALSKSAQWWSDPNIVSASRTSPFPHSSRENIRSKSFESEPERAAKRMRHTWRRRHSILSVDTAPAELQTEFDNQGMGKGSILDAVSNNEPKANTGMQYNPDLALQKLVNVPSPIEDAQPQTSELDKRAEMSAKLTTQGSPPDPLTFTTKKGDPRMNRSVAAKIGDPDMPLVEALLLGGFNFPTLGQPGMTDQKVRDLDNITLHQRKNQLIRRIRNIKNKQQKLTEKCGGGIVATDGRVKGTGDTTERETVELRSFIDQMVAEEAELDHKDSVRLVQTQKGESRAATRQEQLPTANKAIEDRHASQKVGLFRVGDVISSDVSTNTNQLVRMLSTSGKDELETMSDSPSTDAAVSLNDFAKFMSTGEAGGNAAATEDSRLAGEHLLTTSALGGLKTPMPGPKNLALLGEAAHLHVTDDDSGENIKSQLLQQLPKMPPQEQQAAAGLGRAIGSVSSGATTSDGGNQKLRQEEDSFYEDILALPGLEEAMEDHHKGDHHR